MVDYDSLFNPLDKRGHGSHTKICRMLPSNHAALRNLMQWMSFKVSVRLGSTFSASLAEKASIAVIEVSGGFAAALKISLLAEIVTEVLSYIQKRVKRSQI